MTSPGTNLGAPGPELLLGLGGTRHGSRRLTLEEDVRRAIREGRLSAGMRMPASRVLAADLGVSRRLVVEAYEQLIAEGYLHSRPGAGTYAADSAIQATPAASASPVPRGMQFDFFPGSPDLAGFPRALWARMTSEALRTVPDRALGYPNPQGSRSLRDALASYLRRARGVAADPERVIICSGARQGLWMIARVLAADGRRRIAVEDPSMAPHRSVLLEAGAALEHIAVDADGLDVAALRASAADAVLVTPAHQFPTGVALAPERRAQLLDWARAGGVIIEDDYDAEFRYDRAPIGALQGLAPDHVVYLGSASKTLAPALRLGWMVAPEPLVGSLVRQRALLDAGSPTIDQLVCARMLTDARYDRHLRAARRRYRARRDALAAALARHIPDARLSGLAAGLYATATLRDGLDGSLVVEAARRRSVAIYPVTSASASGDVGPGHAAGAGPLQLVLGYANLSESAIAEGIRRLAEALAEQL